MRQSAVTVQTMFQNLVRQGAYMPANIKKDRKWLTTLYKCSDYVLKNEIAVPVNALIRRAVSIDGTKVGRVLKKHSFFNKCLPIEGTGATEYNLTWLNTML